MNIFLFANYYTIRQYYTKFENELFSEYLKVEIIFIISHRSAPMHKSRWEKTTTFAHIRCFDSPKI